MDAVALFLLKKLNIEESEIRNYRYFDVSLIDIKNYTIIICEDCCNKQLYSKLEARLREEHRSYITKKNEWQAKNVSREINLYVNLLICECCEQVVTLFLNDTALKSILERSLEHPSILEHKLVKMGLYQYFQLIHQNDYLYKQNLEVLFKLAKIDCFFINLL